MNNFGLSDKTIQILQTYFQSIPEITSVKIYGSRALGNYRNGSDIDFSLYGDLDEAYINKIKYEIDELSTPYMFDITNYKTIENMKLKEHIDTYGQLFWSKEL